MFDGGGQRTDTTVESTLTLAQIETLQLFRKVK